MRIQPKRGLHRRRRLLQLAFLTAFFVLLTLTVWPLGRLYLGVFLVADPLIAANSLFNGVWKPAMVLALIMVVVPIFAGRAFCGYVCPMGTLVEITGGKSRPSRLSSVTRERLRRLPVLMLVFSAGLALFAGGAFLLLDPLATLTRSATTLLYPLLDRVARLTGDVLALVPGLERPVDTVTALLSGRVIFTHSLTYGLTVAVLAVFVAILAASWLEPRLWCRDVCPLGALLGQPGRLAVLSRRVDPEACISCGRCAEVCPLDAVSGDFLATDTTRCELGFECADVCPTAAISYGWMPAKVVYSTGRRTFALTSAAVLAVGFFAYTGLSRRLRDPRLIRPPGSRPENELLALCSRCGQCMKVCPTNVLQPAASKTGPAGWFTPEMDFRLASCEWSCNECGKVCPTGAIEPLELAVKRKAVIGRAHVDRSRCIPWVDGQTCLVCQELCPIPDKAIAIQEAEVLTPEGQRVRLGQPVVIGSKCIGCGVCEENCPVPHESAIVVYAVEPERRG